ncbi:hypothetical protein OGATHE_003436 [Ogataea polymorpha]|uniref:Uncharacterized protein n=1 Tax=Ogataea polymorpha TaxID=460523 RepID=A0A9P8T3E2_9ASCO|nr:hypothetical protein OGATHE_003436 [Ogataea polymorpha]
MLLARLRAQVSRQSSSSSSGNASMNSLYDRKKSTRDCWLLKTNSHSLPLGVVVQSLGTHFTANTGLLVSSEWHHLVEVVVSVDPDRAGLKLVGDVGGGVERLGVDTSSKSVLGVVSQLDHLVGGLEWRDHGKWSKDLLLVCSHVWGHVGKDRWLDEESLVAQSLTSGDESTSFLVGDVDVAENLVQLHLGSLGTLESGQIEWVTHLERLCSSFEFPEDLLVNTLLDKHSGSGRAHLSGVVEDTGNEGADGGLDVSVVKHNVGRLSSKLQGHLLEVGVGSNLHDVSSSCGGAGEGKLLDLRVAGNGISRDLTESGHDVHHSGWDSGLLDELRSVQGRQWRALGRLQHHSVTCSQSRTNLPGPHQKREVPWDDLATHSNRLSLGVSVVGIARVDVLAGQLVGPASARSDVVDHERHVTLGQLQSLTVVERLNCGEGILVSLEQLGQVPQGLATNSRVGGAPRTLEGLLCGVDSNIDVLLSGLVNVADLLLGGGVDHLKRFVLFGRNKLVVDKQTGRLLIGLSVRQRHSGGQRVAMNAGGSVFILRPLNLCSSAPDDLLDGPRALPPMKLLHG